MSAFDWSSYNWPVQTIEHPEFVPEDDIDFFNAFDDYTYPRHPTSAYSTTRFPAGLPTLAPEMPSADNLLIPAQTSIAPLCHSQRSSSSMKLQSFAIFETQHPLFTHRSYFEDLETFCSPEDLRLAPEPLLLPSTEHSFEVFSPHTPIRVMPSFIPSTMSTTSDDTSSEAADSAIALARTPPNPSSSPTHLPAQSPTPTPDPSTRRRRAKASTWTAAEDAAAIALMKELLSNPDSASHSGRESRFAAVSVLMRSRYGFERGAASVKNQWNRYLRAKSGVEDRGKMRRSNGLVTSSLKKRRVGRHGVEVGGADGKLKPCAEGRGVSVKSEGCERSDALYAAALQRVYDAEYRTRRSS